MTLLSVTQYVCLYVPGGDNVHLKILVPSIAAGAIIGKGGETIAQVQKEAGARVKMSKANDFYPGKFKFKHVFEKQSPIHYRCITNKIKHFTIIR